MLADNSSELAISHINPMQTYKNLWSCFIMHDFLLMCRNSNACVESYKNIAMVFIAFQYKLQLLPTNNN